MIKEIQIRNFQSHKETILGFSKGVNVIIGPSDSGKTAIIRALRWLIWNRPQGEAFRSSWGGDTFVELQIEDDDFPHVIGRRRGKSENIYTVNNLIAADGPHAAKAMGTDVPPEVLTALNLNEINLQQQLDHPFLLDDSPGEVAQHFNRVAHLDAIDRGLQNVQKWLRVIEQDIKSDEQNLIQLQENLKQYAHLDEMEGRVVALEETEQIKITLIHQGTRLNETMSTLRETERQITSCVTVLQAEQAVDEVLETLAQRKQCKDKQASLMGQIAQARALETGMIQHDKIAGTEKLVMMTLKLFADQAQVSGKLKILKKHLFDLTTVVATLSETEQGLNKLQAEFKRTFPKVCPLCGQEV